MVGSAWSGDAVRDVLLAIAMAEGGKKPCPKWEKVEGIMTDWGYGFSASAIKYVFPPSSYPHFLCSQLHDLVLL